LFIVLEPQSAYGVCFVCQPRAGMAGGGRFRTGTAGNVGMAYCMRESLPSV